MTLDEAREHIGDGVVYRADHAGAPAEDGKIVRVNEQYVFVSPRQRAVRVRELPRRRQGDLGIGSGVAGPMTAVLAVRSFVPRPSGRHGRAAIRVATLTTKKAPAQLETAGRHDPRNVGGSREHN